MIASAHSKHAARSPAAGDAAGGPPRIIAAATLGIKAAIARCGARAERTFESAGIDPRVVEQPARRIDIADYCRLIGVAAEHTGDAAFGARFGNGFSIRNFGPFGELVATAPTLLDGLQRFASHYRWLQENAHVDVAVFRGHVTLAYRIDDDAVAAPEQDAELTLAAFCALVRDSLGTRWAPLETQYGHARQADRATSLAVLGTSARFRQPGHAIVMRRTDVARAPRLRSERRHAELLRQLERRCAADDRAAADRDRSAAQDALPVVRHVVADLCRAGPPSMARVAAELGWSLHRLRRDLRWRGAAFDELVSGVRRELALACLEDAGRPLTDIAMRLGYSELSAFSRAFRGWTGLSPQAHRRSALR